MNNLTERQKAAIYDDAVEELRHRFKQATRNATVIGGNEFTRGRADGAYFAYRESLDLLTASDVVKYANRPQISEWAKNFFMDIGMATIAALAFWSIVGLFCLIFNL